MKAPKFIRDFLTIRKRKSYAKAQGLELTTLDPSASGRIYQSKAEMKLVEIKVIRADGTVEVIKNG